MIVIPTWPASRRVRDKAESSSEHMKESRFRVQFNHRVTDRGSHETETLFRPGSRVSSQREISLRDVGRQIEISLSASLTPGRHRLSDDDGLTTVFHVQPPPPDAPSAREVLS